MWDQLVSQRVNDVCTYQTFPYFCFIDRGNALVELLMNVTYLKNISMNPYIFFGFHTLNGFNVTFMCQLYFMISLISYGNIFEALSLN